MVAIAGYGLPGKSDPVKSIDLGGCVQMRRVRVAELWRAESGTMYALRSVMQRWGTIRHTNYWRCV